MAVGNNLTGIMDLASMAIATSSLSLQTTIAPHQQSPQEHQATAANTLQLWAMISQMLWWTVLGVSICSICILSHSLYAMLTRYRRSMYYHFLTAMILLDLLMLVSIIFNLVSDSAPLALKGSAMCKLTAFLTNATSCYSNWLWVMMFAQRFSHIFFPLHSVMERGVKGRLKSALFNILDDTCRLILLTGLISASTQLWAPFLMREVLVRGVSGAVEGSYCGPDPTVINKDLFKGLSLPNNLVNLVTNSLFKWIAAVESIWTYAAPFSITLLTDVAVLVFTSEARSFAIMSSEDLGTHHHQRMGGTPGGRGSYSAVGGVPPNNTVANSPYQHRQSLAVNSSPASPLSLKIQSSQSMLLSNKRRQRAIRRCLMLATTQLLLNLPNYLLQLVDEFSDLRTTSQKFVEFYLYSDALFYLLYLAQYPMLAIYVQWLHANFNEAQRQRKKRNGSGRLGVDGQWSRDGGSGRRGWPGCCRGENASPSQFTQSSHRSSVMLDVGGSSVRRAALGRFSLASLHPNDGPAPKKSCPGGLGSNGGRGESPHHLSATRLDTLGGMGQIELVGQAEGGKQKRHSVR